MFRPKYKTPSSGQIRVPNRSYHSNHLSRMYIQLRYQVYILRKIRQAEFIKLFEKKQESPRVIKMGLKLNS